MRTHNLCIRAEIYKKCTLPGKPVYLAWLEKGFSAPTIQAKVFAGNHCTEKIVMEDVEVPEETLLPYTATFLRFESESFVLRLMGRVFEPQHRKTCLQGF